MSSHDDPTIPVRPNTDRDLVVSYFTDVEGRRDKLDEFLRDNPAVASRDGRLVVQPGAVLVFGGDAIDRGPFAREIVARLLEAKNRQPAQVVLLAGNRDLNKMRLTRELNGKPLARTPAEIARGPRDALMQWIMSNTMGASEAFGHHRDEIAREGLPHAGEDVVRTYLADLEPGAPLCAYLQRCQLAWRGGNTLYVHGAVTPESFGHVPDGRRPTDDVDAWVERLNAWCAAQTHAFASGDRLREGDPGWAGIIAYQAPVPGTRLNQASVVYGRPTDDLGDPWLPPRGLVNALARGGVRRVVLGHTPSGETPSVLRGGGFECVIADNAYSSLERGVQLVVRDGSISLRGAMPDGDRVVGVSFSTALDDADARVGLRDRASGHLVKGRTDDGRFVLYKCLPGFKRDHKLVSPSELSALDLAEPWPADG